MVIESSPQVQTPTEDDQQELYLQLKRLATSRLKSVSPGQTLSATALVNEAYLKLSKACWRNEADIWSNRRLFFSAAAEAMRQIVVDYYRHRQRKKRGGGVQRLEVDIDLLPDLDHRFDVLEVNEAIEQFELVQPIKAKLVKMRYFAGMTMPECADALNLSLPTVERHWRYARAWLADWLS